MLQEGITNEDFWDRLKCKTQSRVNNYSALGDEDWGNQNV